MLLSMVIFLYLCIVVFDFLPAARGGVKKENILYLSLLSVSFCVLVLYSLNISVPSPATPIEAIIKKLFHV